MIGKTIGKYRFVEELGRGPLGTVYKAIDETLDREVAIKVLNPELSNSELMKHFQTEATTLARLHHSDIATIHEIHHTDTDLLMVMEFVKGETLDHLAERCGPLPPERAAYLVAQVLGALEHAHNAGVVHRDLTPSSVTVTDIGAIKVMDFGMARVAAADQATSDGFALGPPSYMSPERLAGGEVDGRTDVYSAGVIFYRLLTGHVPFEAATPLEMVQKQLSGAPTPLHTYREELPGWCQAIVDRAIARIADDRFPTAEAFRSTLNAAISEATEATGLYAVVQAGTAEPEDLTIAAPIPTTDVAPIPFADAPTVATWTPAASTPPVSATAETQRITPPSAPTVTSAAAAATGTTVVIKRNQFAVVGGLLLALVLGVVVLAIVALRRPATVIMAPAETAATNTPAGATPSPAASTTDPATATGAASAAPTTTPTPPPLEIAPPPLVLPAAPAPPRAPARPTPPPAATAEPAAPAAPARAAVLTTPFRFDARAVVADGDKRRERDATVMVADGTVAVTDKDKNGTALYTIPIDSVIGMTYSNSRQPLWNSPSGPAEAMKVEAGAFGFLKGGRNWFGLQTKDSLLFLRVDDEAVGRVTAGLQERTGLTLQRLAEPKD
jgi:eukaryotic-like serine/threonine-protein kinase